MSQRPTNHPEPQDEERQVPSGSAEHRRAVERLLWTPTEGQDLTKSYFPLSGNSDESED